MGTDSATWWERRKLKRRAMNAFKTGIAAVLCIWLGNMFHLIHAFWAAVTAIVVMQSDSTVTISSCRDRLIGTAIGALMGWGMFYVWHGHYVVYGLSVTL